MGKYTKLYKILKCPINIPINDIDAWQMNKNTDGYITK